MYKLREARLKEFYVNEMDSKNQTFDTKAPITTRHGVMADHTSFESLKSNEIHGTDMSDIKFGNTGGWNVITSSELSDDGKARTEKMLATTEGVTAIKGGQKAFSGKNEELKSERFDGDANNYTYTTGESSNMVLNENIVTGDETCKRTESKSSSVSHTSKVIKSSTNSSDMFDNNEQIMHDHDSRRSSVSTVKSSNVENLDNVKLSQDPARVQEAFRLASQPGTIISRKVEKASETQNMITERKELSDGTIVTTRRYEPISSTHSDIHATVSNNSTTSSNAKTSNNTTSNTSSTTRTSKTVESSTSKTSRDEEAFRLSQQPGNIISRDVTMGENNTRIITEKKELSDGTIVTTKRFEKAFDENVTKSSKNSELHQTFKTSRDEEAFRLAQQPGKIISRDVTMHNPTTKMIVEKKELTDGTIVTTKRYESVDSSSDTKSVKNITKEHNTDEFAKSLRKDTHSVKNESVKETSEKNFRTSRDEEAFRLAQQPGKIISRDVTMHNPTTKMIVEKKELTDGTIVTTKRYENVHEDIKAQNVKNVDTQNVRKITTENNTDRKTQNDIQTQREVVEETVTKKIFDTSCQCPENMHDHKIRDFIRNERTNDQYNVDSEIITNFHNVEKNREETIKKTEVKKVDQEQKRFEDNRKITRELEHDSAHKAFASSLRSVTPPLEKVSTTRIDRRSPSRETQTSKISSSTTTIRKSSNTDIRKSEDFMRSTQSSDRRTSSKSPEKQVKKSTRTSTEEITKSPQKFTDTPRSVSPTKNDTLKRPVAKAPEKQSTPSRESSPTKLNTPTNSRSTSPQKQTRPQSSQKQPRTRDTKHATESDELLSTTIKIDNIDKTINDLKIIQTIDTKDLSATTSVSDLEYISGSDKRLITDLDSEDIQVKIDIKNVNELDDLTIKTTVSEVDETTKGKKVPFNRSETFEERAKKLIGIKSEDEGHITKEVPSYAKPTKASQAPVKDCSPRVSEIRERKAKIDEIEKTVKRNSITNSTDFIKHERQEIEKAYSPSPERSPTRRKPSNQKEQIDNEEITKIQKITRVSSPDKKKPTESTCLSKILDQKPTDPHQRRSRSPTREKTPETHITTAQITISPSRGITSKMVTKTSTVESNKTLKVAPAIKLIKRTSDISSTEPDSETDHELIRNIDKSTSKNTRKKLIQNRKDSAPVTKSTVSSEKEKVSRSISENIIKTDTIKKTATRESPKKESKRPTKCITTKTINLTNVNDSTTLNASKLDNVEVEVTVQQAKSSREPSPNKIIPVPVHTDDEINDDDTLHPNTIIEPDENKPKSKVVNVPIFQEETKQFIGLEITEVGTEKSHVILEEDESNEESEIIQSTTLEKADRKRNSVQIDAIEEDENDDHSHLLSVSQKVNKFNETVDELKKPKASSPFRKEFEVKLEDAPDSGDENFTPKVTEKISKFSKVTEETVKKVEDKMTRSIDEVDEMLKNDECLLSVSDKVNKFTVTAERLSSPTPQKSPELVKNIMKQNVKAKVDNITDSFLNHERSVEREIKTTTKSSDIALKSTEAVKKAREVFEHNSSASRELNRQNDILSRPSVFEAKRSTKVDKKDVKETTKTTTVKSTRESISPDRRSPSKTPPPSTPRRGSGDHHTPVYMKDQVSTKKDLFEKNISSSKIEHEIHHKSLSPQNSIDEKRRHSNSEESHQIVRKISASDKHYMQHTKASLEHVVNEDIKESEIIRTNRHEELEYSRDSLQSPSKLQTVCEPPESPKTPTKFGVELKRTESYKAPQTPRRVSTGSETINIEEIWDLSELERLLEIVVGYEQRRRIRSQIRIVKKKMEEKKMSIETKSKRMSTNFTSSPSRTSRTETVTKTTSQKPLTPRESSSRIITTTTTTTSKISSDKGEPKVTTKTTKVTSSSPREIIESLNKSTKGKATESVVKVVKKTSATSNTQQKKSNVMREQKAETDCITSSYGVGPTDSNGLPLFGLKALRTKSPSANVESKTTGTVISEVSYSENGGPTVTKRKTTKYSSDPSDFVNESEVSVKSNKTERKTSQGKIYSVSKTEQYKGDKEVVTKTAPKVIRNGSVKELKEKFVRKSSSSKVVEQKSETKRSSVERESETCCSSKHCKSSMTKSFLNNEKRASNVKEVVTMMKNADSVQIEGDSTEDAEARALLNKFIGATALMTSIENSSGLSKDLLSGGAKNKKTSSASKVTKTVTSYSTGKAYDINDIWDVDLLKKILEATTSYDDRRKIRERIRQVMADKEETMTKTSSEVQQKGDRIIKTTTTEVITKSTMQPQKKVSPFEKFRQLDRQNSLPNSPSPRTPSTPTTPGGSKINGPMFAFTDPTLAKKASTVKEQLLQWAQMKTKEYENVNIENFSSSWSDGLAFAALIHHFLPDAFDYSKLTPKERRHNFTLAFRVAEEKAGICPLLDVDDMVMYKKPDWKCVFCYVQSIYRRFKDEI